MKFRNLYDPKIVYEDYFEAYFIRPFVHHYTDFGGYEPPKAAALSFLAWLVLTAGVAGILMGQVGLLGPGTGFVILGVIGGLWLLASLPPLVGLVLRASRGELHPWRHSPRFLGVDALLAGASILFFFFGLLMMTTTLRSESLNPNAGYDPEAEETVVAARDTVREEPIFTWQDEAPAVVPTDTLDLSDLDDPDAEAPEGNPDEEISPASESSSADTHEKPTESDPKPESNSDEDIFR